MKTALGICFYIQAIFLTIITNEINLTDKRHRTQRNTANALKKSNILLYIQNAYADNIL